MPLCIMKDISKAYRIGDQDVAVLKGINLAVERGGFSAIMGTSGSGKTTLMNLIGCLDVPTAGSYQLAGQEISELTDDELSVIRNEHIGFVFQNFYLLQYATVLENVLLPTLYLEKNANDTEGRARELLRLVGLSERLKFRPNQLSGGEQQRVAIARALVNNPDLLLADEPTGQLDSKTAAEIMGVLTSMNALGTTVIVITHDAAIAAYAKNILRLKDGMISDE